MDSITQYLNKISYKFPKGYPDMNDPMDKKMLFELVEQQLSLFSDEELTNMVKKDTGIDVKDIDNETELKITFDKLSDDLKKRLGINTPEQFKKALNTVLNLRTQPIILQVLTDKKYNPIILNRYSKEITGLIEDIPDKEREKFLDYLTTVSKQIDFPTSKEGNIESNLEKTGLHHDIISRTISHTTQDEGKKGVGMGELALSILFKNITSAGSKGDLAINGQEFELKGSPATLGEKPEMFKIDKEKLEKLGITKKVEKVKQRSGRVINKTSMLVSGEKIPLNQLSRVISDLYSRSEDKKSFEDTLKTILLDDIKLGIGVDARFKEIDFNDPASIQKNIALMNFVRYANKEGFSHFLVHDYGQGGSNNGEYIYVSGSPEKMADELYNSDIEFENIGITNLRPRILLK
jgi:hypothetical protein